MFSIGENMHTIIFRGIDIFYISHIPVPAKPISTHWKHYAGADHLCIPLFHVLIPEEASTKRFSLVLQRCTRVLRVASQCSSVSCICKDSCKQRVKCELLQTITLLQPLATTRSCLPNTINLFFNPIFNYTLAPPRSPLSYRMSYNEWLSLLFYIIVYIIALFKILFIFIIIIKKYLVSSSLKGKKKVGFQYIPFLYREVNYKSKY